MNASLLHLLSLNQSYTLLALAMECLSCRYMQWLQPYLRTPFLDYLFLCSCSFVFLFGLCFIKFVIRFLKLRQ
ncbi:hypothetical protein AQUCO_04500100v1 [Aquilegia coerulea]|uniref:Uncharacterized protein n=1 Tax=Aquilegia coerulea TaxID=218851 RepID=A0A2G5CM01_AQUCA|nr:hypothetical protein AQUCO_04500100v1 [Aquilegia coerulea]